MKHIYNITKLFGILFLFLNFAACSDVDLNNNSEGNKNNRFTVSGKIITDSNNSGRSAITTFSLPEGSGYSIAACFGTADGTPPSYNWDTENQISGTVDNSTLSYSISLTKFGHWKLVLSVIDSDNDCTEIATNEIDISSTHTSIAQDIVIKPDFTTGTTSSINLKISKTVESADIQNVMWHWCDSGVTLEDSTKKFDEGVIENGLSTVTYNFSEVPVGSYNVQFIFSLINGDEYSFRDVINVSNGFVTDSWYGDSVQLIKNESDGTYSFIVSDALFFTQPKYREYKSTEDNTLYLLYSERSKDYKGMQWDDDIGEEAPVFDTKYGAKGAQVFKTLKGGEKITKPNFESTNFCFGDGCLYVVELEAESYKINKYIESYAGYKKSSDSADLSTCCSSSTEFGPITYENGSVYLFYKDNTSKVKLCKLSVNSSLASCSSADCLLDDLTSVPTTIAVTASTNNSNQTSGVLFYSTNNSGNDILFRQPFTFNEETPEFSLSTTDKKSYELTASNLGFSCYSNIHYGDLIVKENPADSSKEYLYALVYSYGLCKSLYTGEEYEGQMNYKNAYKEIYVSNGGVIKFDVEGTSTAFEPSIWNVNGNPTTIFGWSTQTADQDYYDSDEGTPNVILSSGEVYSAQPQFTEDANDTPIANRDYFYGARKYLARKPNVLVFADDGGFYTYGVGSIYSQNRVVTLDLSNSTFSITDVNVTFSTNYELISDPENSENTWFELR